MSGATILVVEDQPLIRMALADLLASAGFQVLEASDAGEGLRRLMAADRVELVIADVGLPREVNGVMLANRIAEHWPGTRVLMISGHTDPSELDLPSQAAFMSKPVSSTMLLEKVGQMLR